MNLDSDLNHKTNSGKTIIELCHEDYFLHIEHQIQLALLSKNLVKH